MKLRRIALLVAMVMSVAFVAAQAATKTTQTKPAQDKTAGRYAKCSRCASDLNLTDGQKAEAKRIFQASKERSRVVRENKSLTREQKIAQIKEIKRAGYEQFRQILNTEQQKKLDAKRAKAADYRKARKGEIKSRIERARAELNLRPEQETKIKQIVESRKDAFKALKADTKLTPEQKRAEFKKMGVSVKSEIRGVLDAAQVKKFDTLAAAFEKQCAERAKRRPVTK